MFIVVVQCLELLAHLVPRSLGKDSKTTDTILFCMAIGSYARDSAAEVSNHTKGHPVLYGGSGR
jgi:hypothetical protein